MQHRPAYEQCLSEAARLRRAAEQSDGATARQLRRIAEYWEELASRAKVQEWQATTGPGDAH